MRGGGDGGGEVGGGILERRERRFGGFLGGGVAWPAESGDELEKGCGVKVEKAGGGMEALEDALGEEVGLGERDVSEGFGDAERGDVESVGEKELGGDEVFERLVRGLGDSRPFRNYQTFLLRKGEVLGRSERGAVKNLSDEWVF
jgi:hypothetical protein